MYNTIPTDIGKIKTQQTKYIKVTKIVLKYEYFQSLF